MIKLIIPPDLTNNPERASSLFGFGLTAENITKLMDENRPIHITSADLKQEIATDFVIMAGKNQDEIKDRLQPFLDDAKPTQGELLKADKTIEKSPPDAIMGSHIDNKFYVIIIQLKSEQILTVIALDEESIRCLLAKQVLNFRCRFFKHAGPQSTESLLQDTPTHAQEVMLFFVRDQATFEQEMRQEGLIDANTIIEYLK